MELFTSDLILLKAQLQFLTHTDGTRLSLSHTHTDSAAQTVCGLENDILPFLLKTNKQTNKQKLFSSAGFYGHLSSNVRYKYSYQI